MGSPVSYPTIKLPRAAVRAATATRSGAATQAANCPIFNISWGDAARFCNWLQNGQPTGAEGPGTTETGAYTLNGATDNTSLMAVTRNTGATYFIPSENEWYKAAYYKGGSTNAGYWTYPTQSNTSAGQCVARRRQTTPTTPSGTPTTLRPVNRSDAGRGVFGVTGAVRHVRYGRRRLGNGTKPSTAAFAVCVAGLGPRTTTPLVSSRTGRQWLPDELVLHHWLPRSQRSRALHHRALACRFHRPVSLRLAAAGEVSHRARRGNPTGRSNGWPVSFACCHFNSANIRSSWSVRLSMCACHLPSASLGRRALARIILRLHWPEGLARGDRNLPSLALRASVAPSLRPRLQQRRYLNARRVDADVDGAGVPGVERSAAEGLISAVDVRCVEAAVVAKDDPAGPAPLRPTRANCSCGCRGAGPSARRTAAAPRPAGCPGPATPSRPSRESCGPDTLTASTRLLAFSHRLPAGLVRRVEHFEQAAVAAAQAVPA